MIVRGSIEQEKVYQNQFLQEVFVNVYSLIGVSALSSKSTGGCL
jgi:hypothetical protein